MAVSTGILINQVEGTITQAGTGIVALSASTRTSSNVNTLTQTMYLQQKSGTSWYTVATFPKTVNNTNYISDFQGASVVSGGVYRLLVVSKANTATDNDYREGYSDPITIK